MKIHCNFIYCAAYLGITKLPQLKNFTLKVLIYKFLESFGINPTARIQFFNVKILESDFPGGSVVKNLPCNVGATVLVLGLETKIPCASE